MAVRGDLRTMSFGDLLHWAGAGQKSGVLSMRDEDRAMRLELRRGWIAACSSDGSPARLGELLGHPSQAEPVAQLALQIEEALQALFDWYDGTFRFDEGATLDPDRYEVNLPIEDVLLKGRRRHEELQRFRETFPSSAVVLAPASRQPPPELLERDPIRQVWQRVDGRRTLGEVLAGAPASQFALLKLLFRLHQRGMLEVVGQGPRPAAPGATLLDARAPAPAPVALRVPSLCDELAVAARGLDAPVAAGGSDDGD